MTSQLSLLKLVIILSLLFSFSTKAEAQDPRFAQFYAAPDQLNPALNVVYDGQMRFIVNYRDQWSSVLNDVPFRTLAVHYDYRMNVGKNDYLSIGFSGLQDEAGISRLKRTKGQANLAFMKYLGGNRQRDFYLVAGAQAGVGQHSLDWSDLWFSEQFDVGNVAIDFNVSSGEVENRTGRIFPDFSAGLLWYMVGDDFSFYFGGALYHLNTPNISIFENSIDRLNRRYVGHLGGEIAMTEYLSALPAASINFQGPAMDINIGTNFRYTSGELNDLALRIGGWAHIAGTENSGTAFESFTVTSMLEMNTWMLGISYDINTSQLTPASNARGAFEASFIYIIPTSGKRRTKVICPKF
ncbi:MAG: PorP/SprF family type IX secretion system membrane protein [Saprospiraceae bacterium]